MAKLPVFLELSGRKTVIVGGGAVAARKAHVLLRAGASVTVIAPELDSELGKLATDGRIEWRQKMFERGEMSDAFLVFAATDSPSVNREVELDARASGILVSLADDSGESDFQLGATLERGDITVSVATGGRSPALSRIVRDRLDSAITPELVRLAEILGTLREPAKRDLATDKERKRFFDAILESEIEKQLAGEDEEGAEETLEVVCRKFGVVRGSG